MTKTYPESGPVKLHTLLDDNPSTKSFKSGAVMLTYHRAEN